MNSGGCNEQRAGMRCKPGRLWHASNTLRCRSTRGAVRARGKTQRSTAAGPNTRACNRNFTHACPTYSPSMVSNARHSTMPSGPICKAGSKHSGLSSAGGVAQQPRSRPSQTGVLGTACHCRPRPTQRPCEQGSWVLPLQPTHRPCDHKEHDASSFIPKTLLYRTSSTYWRPLPMMPKFCARGTKRGSGVSTEAGPGCTSAGRTQLGAAAF